MPVQYTLQFNNSLIETNAHGVVTTAEILAYLESLFLDSRIQFGACELFNVANASDLQMTYSEIEPFNVAWQRYKARIGSTILVFAPSNLSFGLFRMLISSISAVDPEASDAFHIIRDTTTLETRLADLGFTPFPRHLFTKLD